MRSSSQKEELQCGVMAESIMEGRTPDIKNGLINLSREMDIREEVAPLIEKLDACEKDHNIGAYMVYQLKGGDKTRDLRFESLDRLAQLGHIVDPSNYELVHAATFTPGEALETIYGCRRVRRWIQRAFAQTLPNCFRGTDITCVPTPNDMLYMCAVIDLCGKMVVAYGISDDMTSTLVTDTLRDAIERAKATGGLALLSDQGARYTSTAYHMTMSRWKISLEL